MKNQIWKKVKPELLIVILLICAGIFGIYYVKATVRNILILDYWRIANRLIPPIMDKELTIGNLFQSDWGQSNFLLHLLLTINIKYFDLNCLLSEYAAVPVMLISSIVVYIVFAHAIRNNENNKIYKALYFVPMLLYIFNYNQKEILTIQFAFVFTFRIMSYLIIFALVDHWLRNTNNVGIKCFSGSCILAIMAICLWSQLYFPAMCGATLFVILFDYFAQKSTFNKKKIILCIIWLVSICLGTVIYFSYTDMAGSGNGDISEFVKAFFKGDVIYGCCVMLLAVILPKAIISKMSYISIMLIGAIIIALILGSLIIYVKQHIYKKTYFPLLLIVYGGASIFIIEYGRLGKYEAEQLMASRYVCESTFLFLGVVIILSVSVYQTREWRNHIVNLILIILASCIFWCNFNEMKNADLRGRSREAAINRANAIAEGARITNEDIRTFQVNSIVEIQKGIRYLKKFHLSIFANENYFTQMSSCEGFSDDGWIVEDNQFTITTGEEGKVIVDIYNPFWQEYQGHNILVYINGDEFKKYPVSQDAELELNLDAEREYTISFLCDYDPKQNPPDLRKLYFIVTDVFGM